MPAIDQCEPAVINALQKAGWVVVDRPFSIQVDKPKRTYVYADLKLHHNSNNQTVVIIEVKCFAVHDRLFNEFYAAIGQYVTYREALRLLPEQSPLYLVVPSNVYGTFFQMNVIQSVLTTLQIKLILVDVQLEEVVEWIQ